MEHHHSLHFLFMRGFTVIFVVGGLGVKDQQSGLHAVAVLLQVVCVTWTKDQNQECLTKWKKFEILLLLIPFDFLR